MFERWDDIEKRTFSKTFNKAAYDLCKYLKGAYYPSQKEAQERRPADYIALLDEYEERLKG